MKEAKHKGLTKRKGSPFWYTRIADKNGLMHIESTGTTETKVALQILAKRRTAIAENRHLDVKKVPNTTFFELCEQYWETRGKHLQMKGLDSMIEVWKDGLGNVVLKDLATAKIEKLLNDRMDEIERFGASSRNRHLTMMKAMFNWGVQEGLTFDNPTSGVKRLRESGARTRFLDKEEVSRLLANAAEDFLPILITALHTGMRRGEILKLLWSDVDMPNRVLIVQQSKSGKKRSIPIDNTLYETLKRLPSRFKKGPVFPSRADADKPMPDLQHKFQRLAKKAQLENVRFHDLRHTFASHLVVNGVDIKTVQELLGHANINMTMRYAHLAKSHRTQAVRTLDTAFQTGTKTVTLQSAGTGSPCKSFSINERP